MEKIFRLLWLMMLLMSGVVHLSAQEAKSVQANDFNTPLHLLTPDYRRPYGEVSVTAIKQSMDRILHYLDSVTPARVVDKTSHQAINNLALIDQNSQIERGAFRLTSYEWGVTYSAMLEAFAATSDSSYYRYVKHRFYFLAQVAPRFKQIMDDFGVVDPQMKQLLIPHALDDAGAICAAMIKFQQSGNSEVDLRSIIDRYIDYIMKREYRLADGTFARNRPQKNTVWLDDLYMSVPAIVRMGQLTGQSLYYNEAVKQIKQFSDRMFVSEIGLFRHGWVESMTVHPAFFWGRANGWALLTMTEVLDVLPLNHPGRASVLALLQAHIAAIAFCQSGDGLWHQLLDRNDSYLETSASAIYVYCIARAINSGWVDALAYGPVVQLGWNAVSSAINGQGQVEGTCVGTGMAFDPAYYYHRPVNVYAAHGYGPVLMAGAEMIRLLNRFYPRMNDSAVQYYQTPQITAAPIFEVVE